MRRRANRECADDASLSTLTLRTDGKRVKARITISSQIDTSNDSSTTVKISFGVTRRELDERTSLVSVEGELDLSTAPQLKWTLIDALEDGHDRLVVDLSLSSFMDSTALGVLVGVNRNLALGARMAIACKEGNVLNIFELSGMDAAFAIFPTAVEAIAHVQGTGTGAN